MTVTELCVFTATDTFLADPSLANKGMKFMADAEGNLGSYRGVLLEDPKKACLVIVWETLEHHKNLMKSESYSEMIGSIKSLIDGPLCMEHFSSDEPTTAALTAPLTEIAIFTVKEGADNREKFLARLEALVKVAEKKEGIHMPAASGWTEENGNRAVILLGWDSLEAHKKAAGDDDWKACLGPVVEVADLEVTHSKFTKWVS